MNIKKYLSFFDNKKPSSPSEFRQSGPGRRSGPLPGRRRRGGDDAVHDEFREAAPGQGAEILLVVQFARAAALQHQPPGKLRVAHRKFEFVGLDRPGRLRADARLDELSFVGFENHGGRTTIGNNRSLGKVLSGYGNDGQSGEEGVVYKNVIGTYLHGPLLPKNPQLADLLISRALEKKYGKKIELEKLDDSEEQEANSYIFHRFVKNEG